MNDSENTICTEYKTRVEGTHNSISSIPLRTCLSQAILDRYNRLNLSYYKKMHVILYSLNTPNKDGSRFRVINKYTYGPELLEKCRRLEEQNPYVAYLYLNLTVTYNA
ncbi:LOW QUALITY PROTEIN: uncharacterized protein T551_02943 [Pneumocystis jirovecii RU7]|uniref:Uncharacterized protein n=1 Tax=Pneumocystis jirovecii (strain RU7) TaxID=1408657 RepID=A0A0W4ZHY0_PNEJ7|nr:LOW QUALITY PROTEIN: uncharacterized protein T551_02943 [Pneumocystis jirovecii RU7]KTW27976.1 LOW QUALITY PROTEIN: hypothetical protein T551_02943 [Pneumocystis jirovecii RU7]